MEAVRLNKYLAECGICSRREADRLIEEGRVTINGETAGMGRKVTEEDEICVNGKVVRTRNQKVVLAYYKPVGVTCTEQDSHADKKITDMVRYPIRVTYAGRLDKNSEGLMILTNDGQLIENMMRGANRHEKEYVVKVGKEITDDFLKSMEKGVYLKELDITTRECRIQKTGKYTFQLVLTQGLNRQIRRMCSALGYKVISLKRIRIMNLMLEPLKTGQYREVTGAELKKLYEDAGMGRK